MFNAPIVDPLTGQPFSNNTIPAERVSPVAQRILDRFIPLPNTSDPTAPINFISTGPLEDRADQEIVRADWILSDEHKFSFRFFDSDKTTVRPFGRNVPNFELPVQLEKKNFLANWTWTVSPNLVNEAIFSFNRSNGDSFFSGAGGAVDPAEFGIDSPAGIPGLPLINITGFLNAGIGNQWKDVVNEFQWTENFVWTRGNHSLKIGFEVRRVQDLNVNIGTGDFTFNGSQTGDPFADFLLGAPARISPTNNFASPHLRSRSWNWYFSDTWKVTQNFTLNYGIRYEIDEPPYENDLFLVNFDPFRFQKGPNGEIINNGLIDSRDPIVPSATITTDKNNFAPRLGFSYEPFDRTVVRAGYGIFYDTASLQRTQEMAQKGPPFRIEQQFEIAPGQIAGFNFFKDQLRDPRLGPVLGPDTSFRFMPVEIDPATDYIQQWNLTIEREWLPGLAISTAYVGTKGTKLFRVTNINPPIPENNFERFFTGFGPILQRGENGNSNYHALQISANKRFADGTGFLVAYTWGRVIDDTNESRRFTANAAGSVFNNAETTRGLAGFDRRNRLVVSYDYMFPTKNLQGPMKRFLDGWGISGVTTFESGPPFDVTDPVSASRIDRTNGSQGNARSDLVAGVNPIPDNPTPDFYINPAAFQPAPADRFGNQGRNIFNADGIVNFDLVVKKVIPIQSLGLGLGREGARIEFRAEFFNLFNNNNFDPPSTNLFSPAFGVVSDQRINSRVIQFALKGFF